MNTNTIAVEREKAETTDTPITDSVFPVKVVYPENVPETVRQRKINHIYDIFIGAICRSENEVTVE